MPKYFPCVPCAGRRPLPLHPGPASATCSHPALLRPGPEVHVSTFSVRASHHFSTLSEEANSTSQLRVSVRPRGAVTLVRRPSGGLIVVQERGL